MFEFLKRMFKKKKEFTPYIEKDTECDKCDRKLECLEKGCLLEITTYFDSRPHYVKELGCVCIKECQEFDEMKLSEVLEIADTEDTKNFIKEAIYQLGDITYREFYKDGEFMKMNI